MSFYYRRGYRIRQHFKRPDKAIKAYVEAARAAVNTIADFEAEITNAKIGCNEILVAAHAKRYVVTNKADFMQALADLENLKNAFDTLRKIKNFLIHPVDQLVFRFEARYYETKNVFEFAADYIKEQAEAWLEADRLATKKETINRVASKLSMTKTAARNCIKKMEEGEEQRLELVNADIVFKNSFTLIDIRKIPHAYLKLDEDQIENLIRAVGQDAEELLGNGIRIVCKADIRVSDDYLEKG